MARRQRRHSNRIVIVHPMASVALDFWGVITSESRRVYENMEFFLILTTREERRCTSWHPGWITILCVSILHFYRIVIDFINEQLVTIQQQSDTIHSTIFDPQTRLRLFQSCTVQKIPHLLLTDALHNLDIITLDTNTPFTRYNGPLTSAINDIISNFLSKLLNLESLPEYSRRRISQLDLKNGGLGMYDPQSRALVDLALNIQTTSRNAIRGIITHPHLPPTKLDITIRFHSILPNLASIACPPTIPQDQLCQYTIFPHNSITKASTRITSSTSNDMADHTHLLPSILSPTTSYPIAGMSRLQISHQLPPIPFALNMRRKLRLPILPYEFKCQCNKTYDIYGDMPSTIQSIS